MISTTDADAAQQDSPGHGIALNLPRDAQDENVNDAEQEEEEKEEEDDAQHEVGREEEQPQDCFFDSSDQFSLFSRNVDAQSDSDDDYEYQYVDTEIRLSFSSAYGPASDFRCVTFSREQFLAELQEDSNEKGGRFQPGRSNEYDIWMAEPTSVDERRRRLLQGMRIESSSDLAAVLRTCSRKAFAMPPGAADGARASASKPLATKVASPSSSSRHQKTIRRCRSDKELATTRRYPHYPAEPALRRSNSAPPGTTDGAVSRQGKGLGVSFMRTFRVKNLETGKEFMVNEFRKGGNWELSDIREGNQIGIDELDQVVGCSLTAKELIQGKNGGDGCEQLRKDKSLQPSGGTKGSKSAKKKGGWLKNLKFASTSVSGIKSEKEKGEKSSGEKSSGEKSSSEKEKGGKSSGEKSSGEKSSSEKEKGGKSSGEKSSSEKEKGGKSSGEKEKSEKSSGGDNLSELMKVRQHGKSHKDLTYLCNTQEIHAHEGSIWCIKFSWDGHYLASAGVDRVVRVWQVQESDVLSIPMPDQEASTPSKSKSTSSDLVKNLPSRKSKKIKSGKRLHDYIVMPEVMFSLSKQTICSLEGHSGDILDLSWSKSQELLSSSIDKTVRLWDIESNTCLKLFAHNDFVTSIQFNPKDDNHFISGSLDSKVRIWNVPEHRVVDWSDLHEMVTAASYTPDGQGAVVGSHKGNFRLYNTSDSKFTQKGQIQVKKKKKPNAKKITGFQFAPGNPSEVLVTSADSRIRVFNDLNLVHKFRAFRNTSSQMSASYTSDGKFVVCPSEDSHVYIWTRQQPLAAVSSGNKGKGWATTRAHECFYCKDVSVAIPWPSAGSSCPPPPIPDFFSRFDQPGSRSHDIYHSKKTDLPPLPKKTFAEQELPEELGSISCSSPTAGGDSTHSSVSDPSAQSSPRSLSSSGRHNRESGRTADPSGAWGLVVVTAGLDGQIRIYQNFGLPLRLNLF